MMSKNEQAELLPDEKRECNKENVTNQLLTV